MVGDVTSVLNSGLDVRDGLIDCPDAPLEQAYLTYKIGSPRTNIWGPNFNNLSVSVRK